RREALAALLADEANLDDTRNMLRLMIPTESAWSEWDVLRYMGEVASRYGWTDLAPSFVVSLARVRPQAPDRERPEYAALVDLVGEDGVPDLVFDVFAGLVEGTAMRERDRLDAWSLLNRLDPDGLRTGERLRALSLDRRDDPLLAALKRGADELGVVAKTGEELAWLERLDTPDNASFWATSSGAVRVLNERQRRGLALRHLPAIEWSSRHAPDWLGSTREALLGHIERRLDGRVTYIRGGTGSSGQRELFRRTREGLNWGDALTVCVALEALDDSGLASELFRQADIDHNDRTTEHGGVVTTDPSTALFFATHYPPRPSQRFGDNRFVASPEMIEQSSTALVHYHFHASELRHAQYAGPSASDLDYSAHYGRSALVFTFVDGDTLAVDYYQPDRVVVDLGVVERP
ncbi:MAG: hypothetical protein AAGH64_00300, partial [Planctomycetota bacterium]